MRFPRRQFLQVLAGASAVAACPALSKAGTYPNHPVRIIVPFAPGGPADVLARLVSQKLSQSLGQQFYVENQTGAGGNLGMSNGARAAPDGYTITVVGTSFVVNPSLYPKVPYDPYADFAPVTLAAISPNVLVVHPSLPVNNVKELIAFLKANPGKYNFAHPGVGTTPQLAGELFKLSQDVDLVAVPFGGSAPAIQSAVAGHTPIAFTVLTPAVPHIKQGTLRALAVTTAQRSPALRDVPTLAEAGITDQESDTILGILVPARTPQDVVALLYRTIKAGMEAPEVKQKMDSLGFDPVVTTPEAFAARIRGDIEKWGKVIAHAHIKAE
jgi:tripartite-type tricarboxylate transporter receptor subunit TctC